MTQPTKRVLTLLEAAHFLGISKPTLYRAIAARRVKAVKILGRTMIRLEDLESFLGDCPDAVEVGCIRPAKGVPHAA